MSKGYNLENRNQSKFLEDLNLFEELEDQVSKKQQPKTPSTLMSLSDEEANQIIGGAAIALPSFLNQANVAVKKCKIGSKPLLYVIALRSN